MDSDEDKFAELGRYDLINKGVCGKAKSRIDIIGQNGNDGLHYDSEPNEPLEENDPTPRPKKDLTPAGRGGIRTQ